MISLPFSHLALPLPPLSLYRPPFLFGSPLNFHMMTLGIFGSTLYLLRYQNDSDRRACHKECGWCSEIYFKLCVKQNNNNKITENNSCVTHHHLSVIQWTGTGWFLGCQLISTSKKTPLPGPPPPLPVWHVLLWVKMFNCLYLCRQIFYLFIFLNWLIPWKLSRLNRPRDASFYEQLRHFSWLEMKNTNIVLLKNNSTQTLAQTVFLSLWLYLQSFYKCNTSCPISFKTWLLLTAI